MSRIPFHYMKKSFKLQILIPLKARRPVDSDVESFLYSQKSQVSCGIGKAGSFSFFIRKNMENVKL